MFKNKKHAFDEKADVKIFSIFDPEAKTLAFSPPFFAASTEAAYLAVADTVCRYYQSSAEVFNSPMMRMSLVSFGYFSLEKGNYTDSKQVYIPFAEIFSSGFVKQYVLHYDFKMNHQPHNEKV